MYIEQLGEMKMDDLQTIISDTNITIVADDGKFIVGQINVSKEFSPRKINGKELQFWYFNRLIVREDYRNQGYAKKMLSKLIEILHQKRINLWLDINPYGDLNRKQLEELYMKYGFKKYSYGYVWIYDMQNDEMQ
jgi:GNAT superfamily N-acetyltransferase